METRLKTRGERTPGKVSAGPGDLKKQPLSEPGVAVENRKKAFFPIVFLLVAGVPALTGCTSLPVGPRSNIPDHNQRARLEMQQAQIVKQYAVLLHEEIGVRRKQFAHHALTEARAEIEEIVSSLAKANEVGNDPVLASALRSYRTQWDPIARILATRPSESGLKDILHARQALCAETERLTHLLANSYGHGSSLPAEESLEIGVLVTELAGQYLAASMDIDRERHIEQAIQDASRIDRLILRLQSNPDNTARIRGVVRSISKMEWKRIRECTNELASNGDAKFEKLLVIVFSDYVAAKAERLALLYAELDAQRRRERTEYKL